MVNKCPGGLWCGVPGSAWRLPCCSFLVLTDFLLRENNTLPKKELQLEPRGGVCMAFCCLLWASVRGHHEFVLA